MTHKSVPVSVRILEKEYKIACPEGEHDSLLASASLLNDKMREIQDKGKILGGERVAVMAAINIAHELLREKNQLNKIDTSISSRLNDLKSSVDTTLKNMEI